MKNDDSSTVDAVEELLEKVAEPQLRTFLKLLRETVSGYDLDTTITQLNRFMQTPKRGKK